MPCALAQPGDCLWTPELPEPGFSEHLAAIGLPCPIRQDVRRHSRERGPRALGLVRIGHRRGPRSTAACTRLPDLAAVARANSREFSSALEAEWNVGLPGARSIHTPAELDLALSDAAKLPGGWVIKANFGMSARERILSRLGPRAQDVEWARRRIERGEPIFFEPWVESITEFGCQFSVPPSGTPVVRRRHRALDRPAGDLSRELPARWIRGSVLRTSRGRRVGSRRARGRAGSTVGIFRSARNRRDAVSDGRRRDRLATPTGPQCSADDGPRGARLAAAVGGRRTGDLAARSTNRRLCRRRQLVAGPFGLTSSRRRTNTHISPGSGRSTHFAPHRAAHRRDRLTCLRPFPHGFDPCQRLPRVVSALLGRLDVAESRHKSPVLRIRETHRSPFRAVSDATISAARAGRCAATTASLGQLDRREQQFRARRLHPASV